MKKDHCEPCVCHHEEMCSLQMHPLVGDGACQPETNIEVCLFDGQDCCNGEETSSDLSFLFIFIDTSDGTNDESCPECECYGMLSFN